MAQDHGRFNDVLPDASFSPVVDIAAADPGVVDGNENVVRRLNGRFGAGLEGHRVGFVEDKGEILWVIKKLAMLSVGR